MISVPVIQETEALGIRVFSFEAFAKLGLDNPSPPIPPKPEDLCTIMYTSGTTDKPKVYSCAATNNPLTTNKCKIAAINSDHVSVWTCQGCSHLVHAYLNVLTGKKWSASAVLCRMTVMKDITGQAANCQKMHAFKAGLSCLDVLCRHPSWCHLYPLSDLVISRCCHMPSMCADVQGVEISHRAETATVAGVQQFLVNVGYQLDCHDSEISYLPLAHIFDR